MAGKRRVAVFDVDGTIFRSSLLIELVNTLIQNGTFPEGARRIYEKDFENWQNREGSYEDYIMGVVTAFRKYLKGVHYGELADAAQEIADRQSKRTYRYTRDLLAELKARDYYLLAVSHSPKLVLDRFCPALGFDKTYGIMYEVGPQDLFTGAVIDEYLILNKAAIVKRAVEKEGLTLAHSIGVGDTESDISFLEVVAKPVCFNPNAKLYTYGKRMGWKVIVERKDVIYQM